MKVNDFEKAPCKDCVFSQKTLTESEEKECRSCEHYVLVEVSCTTRGQDNI